MSDIKEKFIVWFVYTISLRLFNWQFMV